MQWLIIMFSTVDKEGNYMYYCTVNGKRVTFSSFSKAEAFCSDVFNTKGAIIGIDVSSDADKRYNVVLRYADESVTYLEHKDRMSWSLRVAKKYCKDVNQSLAAGRYAGCIYANVVEAC